MAKMLLTAATLMFLMTACDNADRKDALVERESRTYQSAMADYRAGRLAQAVSGFRTVCRDEPANASARFQLGCLLQDSLHDYLGAYCAYLEYLQQHPKSDKSTLAKDRAALCEREVAKSLAEKHGLTNLKALTDEIDELRRQLKESEARAGKLRDDVSLAMQRITHLRQENGRLKAAVRSDTGTEAPADAAEGIRDAKALLDEDETDRIRLSADVGALRIAAEEDVAEKAVSPTDVAEVRRTLDEDAKLAEKPPLPKAAKRPPEESRKEPSAKRPAEPQHERRPSEYVVQEGDTLYKIAIRFYGRRNAWKLIRDANKATISTDGRVNSGMRIRLPDPQ